MDIDKAKKIVTLLANGTNPVTGEIFPDDSPYNSPLIIRSLYTLLNNIHATQKMSNYATQEKQKQNIASGKPKNSGLPWSDTLKNELATMFQSGSSTKQLAKHFERTEGAILSELVHQGIIDEKDKQNYL